MREGTWRTPLGDVEIDTALADAYCMKPSLLDVDEIAHKYEHSLKCSCRFYSSSTATTSRLFPFASNAGLRSQQWKSGEH
jgi:AmmeMemoRadiSam system protein B